MEFIEIKGARQHNLKGIDIKIPLMAITLVIGPSGSGKSSVAAHVLYPEGRLRYLEALELPGLHAGINLKRPDVEEIHRIPPALLLEQLPAPSSSHSTLATVIGLSQAIKELLRLAGRPVCPKCGTEIEVFEPRQLVTHLLEELEGMPVSVLAPVDLHEHSIEELLSRGFVRARDEEGTFYLDELDSDKAKEMGQRGGLDIVVDRLRVEKKGANRLLESIRAASELSGGTVLIEGREGPCRRFNLDWSCSQCGLHVDPGRVAFRLLDMDMGGWLDLDARGLLDALKRAVSADMRASALTGKAFQAQVAKIEAAAEMLVELGIENIALSRPATELSAGELHRARLLRLYRKDMAGLLYILDEPLSRYMPGERQAIWRFIMGLKAMGNTVVIVEHDMSLASEQLHQADWIVELGPGAGEQGGRLIYQGPSCQWPGMEGGPGPVPDRIGTGRGGELKASVHVGHPAGGRRELDLPESGLLVVRGPSGSGKSRLLSALYRFFGVETEGRAFRAYWIPRVLKERSPYSIVASSAGIWADIRRLFSRVPEARSRGLTPSYFSLTKKGGRCEQCRGLGLLRQKGVGFQLFEEICPVCGGRRYCQDLLSVEFKGYSIADILGLQVDQALKVFSRVSRIQEVLHQMARFGLGYLRLGQPVMSLSGGERQRLRLIQLRSRGTGYGKRAIFFLDEPSVGLSYSDMLLVYDLFSWLSDQGNLIVVADNSEFLKEAATSVIETPL